MEAMAGLGHTGGQFGSPFSPPCSKRGAFSSRHVACVQSVSPAFATNLRLCPEQQESLVLLENGAKRVRNYAFGSRANNLASSHQSYAEVGAKHPKLVPLFPRTKDKKQCCHHICHCQRTDQDRDPGEAATDEVEETWGVQIAIAALKFYKGEISPLLPGSCRYVPTCSEYSIQAYKTYGVLKGTILTACRLARCNPLGGSGFDPPRWFGETKPPSL